MKYLHGDSATVVVDDVEAAPAADADAPVWAYLQRPPCLQLPLTKYRQMPNSAAGSAVMSDEIPGAIVTSGAGAGAETKETEAGAEIDVSGGDGAGAGSGTGAGAGAGAGADAGAAADTGVGARAEAGAEAVERPVATLP